MTISFSVSTGTDAVPYIQITLTIGGSNTVRKTSRWTGLDLTKQVNLLLIKRKQST